ncbi:hypothetical protein C1645_737166 [Glomus cerebriforme]|uniref:Myb/SANT-like DNA-binding domain-containing protein n=1 Tax=Glomus cerebriforme TaxID=658196 RepID=A0A397T4Y1_9GLOM|nr:hypothetical protein C1645_737166 [Glomus cerebriforme]
MDQNIFFEGIPEWEIYENIEEIHQGIDEGICNEFHEGIYEEFFEGICDEFHEGIYEEFCEGICITNSRTYLSPHTNVLPMIRPTHIVSNQQDNSHQLVDSGKATREIINQYSMQCGSELLSAAIDGSIDRLRERNPSFRQSDYQNNGSSIIIAPTIPCIWSEEATKNFFFCLEKCKEVVALLPTNHGNVKCKLWKYISDVLIKNGHKYSPRQCEYKWKNTKQGYNKWKKSNNKTKFRYKSECEKILSVNKVSSGFNDIIFDDSRLLDEVDRPKKAEKVEYAYIFENPNQERKNKRMKRKYKMKNNNSNAK